MRLEHNNDAGGASIVSVTKLREKVYFNYSYSIPDVKFLDNLTNTGEVTLELKLSQLQHHPNAHDATLGPALY